MKLFGSDGEENDRRGRDKGIDHKKRDVLRAVGASTVTSIGLGSTAIGQADVDTPPEPKPDPDRDEIVEILGRHADKLETFNRHGLVNLSREDDPVVEFLNAIDEVTVKPVTDTNDDRKWFLTMRKRTDEGEVTIGFDLIDPDHGYFKSPEPIDDEAILEEFDEQYAAPTDDGCSVECLNDNCCCNMCGCDNCPTTRWCNACECTTVFGYKCNDNRWALMVCDCCLTHPWCSLHCPYPSYDNC